MRVILGALVALLIASTATAQTTIEQRNQWRRQAAEYEATAAGLRKAAECEMPDFPTGWQYRMEVTPQDLRSISGTVVNFPAKLTIASANLSSALANGHDILFTKTDGTTVLPSYRVDFSEVAGVPTWRGIVLLDSYTPDDTLFVNYANPDASDASTTAAMTGGGWIHWLNFQADPAESEEGQLLDAITGAPGQIVNGQFLLVDGQSAGWKAWHFADNAGYIRFQTPGQTLQQPAPFARFMRVKFVSTNALFSYTSFSTPSVSFPWTGFNLFGQTGLGFFNTFVNTSLIITPFDQNSWQAYSDEVDEGTPSTVRTWWKGTPSQEKTWGSTFRYQATNATCFGPNSATFGNYFCEEFAILQHGLGNTYHQALAFNTGAVTLSEQEEAPTPVTEPSADSLRRLNSAQGLADARRIVVSPQETDSNRQSVSPSDSNRQSVSPRI